MVRHAARRRLERSEPVMFWEADDQEICMLTLGCSNDPGHFSSVDQNCVRVNAGRCRSLYSALLKSSELAALSLEQFVDNGWRDDRSNIVKGRQSLDDGDDFQMSSKKLSKFDG
jgi:hypothetical protein